MEEALYIYEPNTSELSLYTILGFAAFVLCSLLFYYSLKHHKQLLLLFSGFLGVIGLGVGIFSIINQQKLPNIEIYQEGLSTPQGKVSFDDIRKIELKEDKQHSKYPIHRGGEMITIDTIRMILVEEYSGKAHVMTEFNYPLQEIYSNLSVLVKAYQEKKEKEESVTNPE